MEGDGMSAADKVKEADWRLFRSRLPIWQEAYMERLNREYIALLSGTGSASEKFWELERRMREDKRRGGVVMRMSRSNMELDLLSLLSDGVISTAELDGFSEELREKLVHALEEGQSAAEVDDVLDALESKNYLSDERYARSRVRMRSARYGNRRLAYEVQEALQEAGDEFERAWVVWSRRYGNPPEDYKEKTRQARFLAARGFGFDMIERVFDKAREEACKDEDD